MAPKSKHRLDPLQTRLPFAPPRKPVQRTQGDRKVVDCRPNRSGLVTKAKLDAFFRSNDQKAKDRARAYAETTEETWDDFDDVETERKNNFVTGARTNIDSDSDEVPEPGFENKQNKFKKLSSAELMDLPLGEKEEVVQAISESTRTHSVPETKHVHVNETSSSIEPSSSSSSMSAVGMKKNKRRSSNIPVSSSSSDDSDFEPKVKVASSKVQQIDVANIGGDDDTYSGDTSKAASKKQKGNSTQHEKEDSVERETQIKPVDSVVKAKLSSFSASIRPHELWEKKSSSSSSSSKKTSSSSSVLSYSDLLEQQKKKKEKTTRRTKKQQPSIATSLKMATSNQEVEGGGGRGGTNDSWGHYDASRGKRYHETINLPKQSQKKNQVKSSSRGEDGVDYTSLDEFIAPEYDSDDSEASDSRTKITGKRSKKQIHKKKEEHEHGLIAETVMSPNEVFAEKRKEKRLAAQKSIFGEESDEERDENASHGEVSHKMNKRKGNIQESDEEEDDDDDMVVTPSRRKRKSIQPESGSDSDDSSIQVLEVKPAKSSSSKSSKKSSAKSSSSKSSSTKSSSNQSRKRRSIEASDDDSSEGGSNTSESSHDSFAFEDEDEYDDDDDEEGEEEEEEYERGSHRACMMAMERERNESFFQFDKAIASPVHQLSGKERFYDFVELLARVGDPIHGHSFLANHTTNRKLIESGDAFGSKLGTMVESQFGTMAWKAAFRDDIRAYPYVHVRRNRSFCSEKCGACGRSHHVSHELTLCGKPYDAFTFHNSLRWDKGIDSVAVEKFSADRDSSVSYYLGSTCRLKALLYHSGWHFKYRLFRRIKNRMNSHFEGRVEDFLEDSFDGDNWKQRQLKKYNRYMKLVEKFDMPGRSTSLGDDWELWSTDGGYEEEGEEEEEEEIADEDGIDGENAQGARSDSSDDFEDQRFSPRKSKMNSHGNRYSNEFKSFLATT